jgi:hypothetical protein
MTLNRATLLLLTLVLVLSGAVTHLQAQPLFRQMWLPDTNSVHSIALSKSGTIYVGTTSNVNRYTNILRSTDNGYSWKSVSDTSWNGQLKSLTVGPNGNVYVVVGMVLYGSTNDGASWDTLDVSGVSFHTVAVTKTGTIFTTPGYALGMRRSTDGGATWTKMKLPLTEVDVFAISSTGTDTIYAGADGWSVTSFMRSTDNGETWTAQSEGMVHFPVFALTQYGQGHLFVGTQSSDSNLMTIYRSNDYGTTWEPAGLKKAIVTSLVTNARGDLFAGMRTNIAVGWTVAQSGVYRSTDNGGTWSSMNDGLADSNVNVIVIDADGGLLVGTDRGLYRSVSSSLDAGDGSIDLHEMAVDCMPNPVSSNATIQFTLPVTGHVRLGIFNALGKEITVALDRTMNAGVHTVVFDSKTLPAGRYYIRMTAGGNIVSRTMVHLR